MRVRFEIITIATHLNTINIPALRIFLTVNDHYYPLLLVLVFQFHMA